MRPRPLDQRSLGFLEVASLARGVVSADAMVKTAPVTLVLLAPVSGGRMLVAIDGPVAAVEAALAHGVEVAAADLVDALFIPDLHPDVPAALQPDTKRGLDEALGLIETSTAAGVVRAADAARKTAAIQIVRLRLAMGISGKGFLQITGKVADVEAGVAAAAAAVVHPEFMVRQEVISSPHEDIRSWLGRRLQGDMPPFDTWGGE
jgi:microcompartment protein CcmL/EutN